MNTGNGDVLQYDVHGVFLVVHYRSEEGRGSMGVASNSSSFIPVKKKLLQCTAKVNWPKNLLVLQCTQTAAVSCMQYKQDRGRRYYRDPPVVVAAYQYVWQHAHLKHVHIHLYAYVCT